ncbi:MAG: PAS domain-containing protein [Mariprofundales bacterium]|nr:PAS domain-containing protein [Mariprofundales bacterium]
MMQAEEMVFAPLEHVHEGVLVFGRDYCVLFCNQRLATWLDLDAAVLVGSKVAQWLPRFAETQYQKMLENSFAQMTPLTLDAQADPSLVVCAPDGGAEMRHCDALLSPYLLGDTLVMQLSLRDCTDRVDQIDALEGVNGGLRREVRLRGEDGRQNALLAAALDAAAEAVIVVDHQGRVQYANQAFFAISQIESPSVRNQPLLELLALDQLDEDLVAHVRAVLSDGDPWRGRVVVCRRDGGRFPALVSTAPLAGKRGYAVIILEDISEYERADHARKTQEKHAAMLTLVGGIAHDFNNLLSGVVGNLYLLRKSLLSDASKTERRITNIESTVAEISQIVSDLLVYARGDDVSQGVFALSPFVKEWCKGVREALGEDGTLKLELQPCHVLMRADVSSLQIVLDVLAHNAIDAVAGVDAPALGIAFSVVDQGDAFPDGLSPTAKYVRLSLNDNGGGVASDDLPLIFDPFFSTKRLGRGLGLPTAKSCVEGMGGALEIYSQPGAGTQAVVWLPFIAE